MWLQPVTTCLWVFPGCSLCVLPLLLSLVPPLSRPAGGRELTPTGINDHHMGPQEALLKAVWRWDLLSLAQS